MQTQGSTAVAGSQQVSAPVPATERRAATTGTGAAGGGSPLRARMLAQMAEKGLAEATQAAYVRGVLGLVAHCAGRAPEAIAVAEARAYVRGLKAAGASPAVYANASAGIRFLYEQTLGQVWRPVSPLRRRMLEDMALRGFTEKTQGSYVRAVEGLARYFHRRPDTLSDEELRQYFVHLKCERRLARPTITIALCGIKFFFESTLGRDFSLTGIPRPKRAHALPVVLSRAEVRAILRQITEPRHRACLTLIYHPHLHILATGGGLDPSGAWRPAHPKFLVPVRALSTLFAARFRDALREQSPGLFARIPAAVWRRPWVVHSKPVGAGAQALAYLARYVHRVALADAAILHHDAHQVVFRYRDSATGQTRTARLAPQEFIRRFLQHVLPKGFHKVRHYGLHHSSQRATLRLLQAQLAFTHRQPLPPADPPTRPPAPAPSCPRCHAPMVADAILPPLPPAAMPATARGPPAP